MERTYSMTDDQTFLRKALFFGTLLTFGCTGGGAAGCGSGGDGGANVDSDLLGVYQVTEYRFTENGCDGELTTAASAGRIVLYAADEDAEAVILGGFCGDVEGCRTRAREKPPTVNYGFFRGSDTDGWEGWAVAGRSMVGEMCRYDVQTHVLTSPSDGAIRIDTRQVETLYTGEIVDGTANCTDREAVANVREDSPCQTIFELVAEFETGL